MVPKTLDVHEAQSQLPDLLPLVTAGAEIIITAGSTPVARLVPMESHSGPRRPGLHAGTAWLSADFDAPRPDEF